MTTDNLRMSQAHELWFHDGTVVFEAGHELFCLHAGLLSARSAVFRHMLEDKSSDIDGRLLIKLPDHSTDLHNFFLAVYDIIPGSVLPILSSHDSTSSYIMTILKEIVAFQVF